MYLSEQAERSARITQNPLRGDAGGFSARSATVSTPAPTSGGDFLPGSDAALDTSNNTSAMSVPKYVIVLSILISTAIPLGIVYQLISHHVSPLDSPSTTSAPSSPSPKSEPAHPSTSSAPPTVSIFRSPSAPRHTFSGQTTMSSSPMTGPPTHSSGDAGMVNPTITAPSRPHPSRPNNSVAPVNNEPDPNPGGSLPTTPAHPAPPGSVPPKPPAGGGNSGGSSSFNGPPGGSGPPGSMGGGGNMPPNGPPDGASGSNLLPPGPMFTIITPISLAPPRAHPKRVHTHWRASTAANPRNPRDKTPPKKGRSTDPLDLPPLR